jgi:hypothetical protein
MLLGRNAAFGCKSRVEGAALGLKEWEIKL